MMRRERDKSEERIKSKPVPITSVANVAQDDLEVMGFVGHASHLADTFDGWSHQKKESQFAQF